MNDIIVRRPTPAIDAPGEDAYRLGVLVIGGMTLGDVKDANASNDIPGTCKGLTVDELRQRLAGFDANAFVLLPGQEGGFHAISEVQAFDVMMDVNTDPLFGPHDVPRKRQRPDARVVVLLGGPGRSADKSSESSARKPIQGSS